MENIIRLKAIEILCANGSYGVKIIGKLQQQCAEVSFSLGRGSKSTHDVINMINGAINQYLMDNACQKQMEFDSKMGEMTQSMLWGKKISSAISLLFAKLQSRSQEIELWEYIAKIAKILPKSMPIPRFVMLNGGTRSDNCINMDDYSIVPVSAGSFHEGVRNSKRLFDMYVLLIAMRTCNTLLGDDGGLAPNLWNERDCYLHLMYAMEKLDFIPGIDFQITVNVPSYKMYTKEGAYFLWKEDNMYTKQQYYNRFFDRIKHYPVLSVEDLQSNKDTDDSFLAEIKNVVTLPKHNWDYTNLTITELVQIANKDLISISQDETNETSIADIAIGLQFKEIKLGGLTRGEQTEKINRLIEIEDNCCFAYNPKDVYQHVLAGQFVHKRSMWDLQFKEEYLHG